MEEKDIWTMREPLNYEEIDYEEERDELFQRIGAHYGAFSEEEHALFDELGKALMADAKEEDTLEQNYFRNRSTEELSKEISAKLGKKVEIDERMRVALQDYEDWRECLFSSVLSAQYDDEMSEDMEEE